MHTGCQWAELPIDKDIFGDPEIHHQLISSLTIFASPSLGEITFARDVQ